jgi:VIT1/CCC1 family predicted Fe2+/Mn2+ transporter
METVSRRAFTRDLLGSMLTASLLTGLSKAGAREYIDPLGAQKLEGGLIRARRMTDGEAYRMYGKT